MIACRRASGVLPVAFKGIFLARLKSFLDEIDFITASAAIVAFPVPTAFVLPN
jgi:hypothetical protein